MLEVISRSEAQGKGLARYFTGKPCKNGHLEERYTDHKRCLGCNRQWARKHGPSWVSKNLEARKKWRQEYTEKNRSSISGRNRIYVKNNYEEKYAYTKEWRLNNPEKTLAYSRNRRARKKSAPGSHSGADILDLFDIQKGKCAYYTVCKTSLGGSYHVDHIVPISRGGHNGRNNLQLTCPSCNIFKNDTPPNVFATKIGMLI